MEAWDPGAVKRKNRLHAFLRLTRIEHTLFSLPFAYAGATLSGYPFTAKDALLIFTALLGLRISAMSYNNIADLDIDRLNPRSRLRPLVTGALTVKDAYMAVALGSLLYFMSAYLLNWAALLFSPLLWILAHTYPYAKRLHPLPHIHLGLVLGFSVFGGAVAASGDEAGSLYAVIRSIPWDYVLAVTLWVSGFDIIYSIMDIQFDRQHSLRSIPALLGPELSKIVALGFHISASLLFTCGILARTWMPLYPSLPLTVVGVLLMVLADIYVLKGGKPSTAFNVNLIVGLLVSLGLAFYPLLA